MGTFINIKIDRVGFLFGIKIFQIAAFKLFFKGHEEVLWAMKGKILWELNLHIVGQLKFDLKNLVTEKVQYLKNINFVP